MWRERILAARERGNFTTEDWNDAIGCHEGLGAFSRCAVGEQADKYGAELLFRYPKKRIAVLDPRMQTLGICFAGAVMTKDFYGAERVLDLVEDRALELKRLKGQ